MSEEQKKVPQTEDECIAAGGTWKDGKCILETKKGRDRSAEIT